ncbi:MAG: zinc ribbon domain-containing protein, partial [Anaerolineales bacterium]|nr:zinc ribbon domain-containing protein [Anaerolineales bacterium]
MENILTCPNCGFNNPAEAKFCAMCGERLRVACPNCSHSNPPEYKFCINCGLALQEAEPVPSQERMQIVKRTLDPVAQSIPASQPPATPVRHLEGERRVATVILADVRSSTDLLELIGTENWVDTMNGIFQVLET